MTSGARFPAAGRGELALLEQSLREKDDIIQAQYAELVSTRARLELAVRMLNEATGATQPA